MEIIPGVHDIDLGMVHAFIYQEADRLTLIDTGLANSGAAIVGELGRFERPAGIGHQHRRLEGQSFCRSQVTHVLVVRHSSIA